MYPHGNWSPELPVPFHDHAGMFSLEGHGSQMVAMTWNSVLANMKALQGGSTGDVLCLPDKLLFTHRLFRVCSVLSFFTFTPIHHILALL